jgi:hypothetical protein
VSSLVVVVPQPPVEGGGALGRVAVDGAVCGSLLLVVPCGSAASVAADASSPQQRKSARLQTDGD